MEKQRIKRQLKSRKRLLISTLLFGTVFFSWAQTNTTTQKLFPVENQKLYPKQDIKYEIEIPKVKPNNVQLQTPNLSSGVELKTLRKSEFYTDEGGTLLELWYRFDKKGKYNIPRLSVLVNGRRRYYYFEPIEIEEDPANMLPRMVIQFENGKSIYSDDFFTTTSLFDYPVGEKLNFKVSLQYSTQLVQFNWEIPENSIFKQVKTYEITEIRYREKNYSNELIPVADFEWTSLAKGNAHLPKIKLVATAYKGYRSELSFPSFSINFVENHNAKEETSEIDRMFEAAFDNSSELAKIEKTTQITMEDCIKIAELRGNEKYNPFAFIAARNQRKTFEESLGLPSDANEFNLILLYLFSIFVVFFGLIFALFIIKKRTIGVIISAMFLICSIAMGSYSAVRASKKYAISTNCHIYSIPETNANSTSEISAGNRILITEQTGSWYYVELGSINGWCKRDEVILIK